MRFVFILPLIVLGLGFSAEQPQAQMGGQPLPVIDLVEKAPLQTLPALRKGKRANNLMTAEGFETTLIASNLGNLSAITTDMKGNLFAADQQSGRIWHLPDRAQDGRVDQKRALAHRFDNPTGLALHSDILFVADRNAIWRVKGDHPPTILAGLRAANSTAMAHPLSLSSDGLTLFLGLQTNEGEVKLLSIDTETGTAELVETQKSDQPILALVDIGAQYPWVLQKDKFGPTIKNSHQFRDDLSFAGISPVPDIYFKRGQKPAPANHPIDENSLLVSRRAPDGFDVLIIPTKFGQPQSLAYPLLSGFFPANSRTAWGAPAALTIDSLGLLVTDAFNGDIYRVTRSAAPTAAPLDEPNPVPPLSDEPASTTPPSTLLSTIEGSQIGLASTLEGASSLDVGSTIIRDYKPLSLDDEKNGEDISIMDSEKSRTKDKRSN
ncbi:hypothetical protein DES40_2554 [Litorimonas taeanensis]|uniref:Uncharacterized protein n=1 Tax=Litorimonas taeanensis TaxID=568099 RepID=A0A420WFK8_9PROT|nr:hypothetical protein [Litorimonas taeanensis]RKQ69745.1 hypothetical protein DES40_2554 [Litorimonas taeanensis]